MKSLFRAVFTYMNALFVLILNALGGLDRELSILLCLMGLDIISGIACAFVLKSKNTEGGGFLSKQLFAGLFKKLFTLILLALASLLDSYFKLNLILRSLAVGFYIANEAMSIVENTALLGVPFPKGIKKALEVLKEKSDEGELTSK